MLLSHIIGMKLFYWLIIFTFSYTLFGSASEHTLFIKNDGSLWGMGFNTSGQLGDGSSTNRSVPVQILSSGVQAVATGDEQSLILKNDGSLWAMGKNNYGQLGDSNSSNQLSPIYIRSGVRFISSYSSYTHFIDNNNNIFFFFIII